MEGSRGYNAEYIFATTRMVCGGAQGAVAWGGRLDRQVVVHVEQPGAPLGPLVAGTPLGCRRALGGAPRRVPRQPSNLNPSFIVT